MMNQEETKEVKNGDKYNIPMLEKSFELLELLIKYPNGLTMQETVNLLNTLLGRQIVPQLCLKMSIAVCD